jgi:hypothetical protein
MPVQQFRCAGPIQLEDCSKEELKALREAVSRPGSQLRTVVLYVDKDDEKGTDIAHVFGNASEKLSACMWAKKLGVPRIQKLVVQCTDGIEQTARAHRAKWGIDLESEERYEINQAGSVHNIKKRKAVEMEANHKEEEDKGEGGDEGDTMTTQAKEEEEKKLAIKNKIKFVRARHILHPDRHLL